MATSSWPETGASCWITAVPEHPPADGKQLVESLAGQSAYDTGVDLLLVGGDRQFDTKAVAKVLEQSRIEDMNCPRDTKRLAARQGDWFSELCKNAAAARSLDRNLQGVVVVSGGRKDVGTGASQWPMAH